MGERMVGPVSEWVYTLTRPPHLQGGYVFLYNGRQIAVGLICITFVVFFVLWYIVPIISERPTKGGAMIFVACPWTVRASNSHSKPLNRARDMNPGLPGHENITQSDVPPRHTDIS